MNKLNTSSKKEIDLMITLLPLTLIVGLSILFFFYPEQSNTILSQIRFLLGDTFGVYYLIIGLGIFLISLYIAFSKYGDIILGSKKEKPKIWLASPASIFPSLCKLEMA